MIGFLTVHEIYGETCLKMKRTVNGSENMWLAEYE